MIRCSKIFLYFTAAALLAWLLPWFYHFATASARDTPFTLYSCVSGEFASIDYSEKEGIRYRGASGTLYSDKEFDSILPLFYYRQLISDGRLPDTINGEAVSAQQIGLHNFIFRSSPSDLNKKTAPLYPLLEAMSGRVDLKMPDDVFRLTDRIEFIDMERNSVNEAKSELFTKALTAKGFEFPVRTIKGNPTTRKDYDEGYFLVDNAEGLFHLKQLRGKPYVRRIETPEGVRIREIFVTEFASRRTYALMTDSEHNFYVLTRPGYELIRLPSGRFDPRTESIMIVGDLFHWTIRISGEGSDRIYAVNARSYAPVGETAYPVEESRAESIGMQLFPFELSFTSYDDQFVRPRIRNLSAAALGINILLAAVFLFLKRRHIRTAFGPAAGIVLLGWFLFIPLLVLRR